MACTEPKWYMDQQASNLANDFAYDKGTLNGTYTISGISSPAAGDIVSKLTIDGAALQSGDRVLVAGQGLQITAWDNTQYISASVDIVEMERRLTRLEQEVAMWKSAAKTLKEINDELREAAEQDRQEQMPEIQINLRPITAADASAQPTFDGVFYCPNIPACFKSTDDELAELFNDIDHADELKQQYLQVLERDAAVHAYNRAMKLVR